MRLKLATTYGLGYGRYFVGRGRSGRLDFRGTVTFVSMLRGRNLARVCCACNRPLLCRQLFRFSGGVQLGKVCRILVAGKARVGCRITRGVTTSKVGQIVVDVSSSVRGGRSVGQKGRKDFNLTMRTVRLLGRRGMGIKVTSAVAGRGCLRLTTVRGLTRRGRVRCVDFLTYQRRGEVTYPLRGRCVSFILGSVVRGGRCTFRSLHLVPCVGD